VTFAGDFTLAGSSLSFGSGTKNLGTVVRTVTVQEAASTMTLGGAVNGAAGGLIKTGDGTLALTGATRAYTGETTVAAGTLSLSNGTFASALTVNDGATLGLDVGATVISSAALTLADGAKVRLTGTPTAESYTLFQATAINGTPVLAAAIPNYQLVVADGGTTLKLNSTGAAPYLSWTGGPFAGTLTNTNPALDFDGGGLKTGIEWVVGGDPTAPGDDAALAPTFDNTSDPVFFIFKYRRTDAAAADAKTTIAAQYGSDLIGWTTAVAGADIVITPADDGAGAGIDLVVVKIRRTLAVGGRLFARLKVEVAMP
jgi:autotransporter-associated beta strand protein